MYSGAAVGSVPLLHPDHSPPSSSILFPTRTDALAWVWLLTTIRIPALFFSSMVWAYPMNARICPEPNRQRFMDIFISAHLSLSHINHYSHNYFIIKINWYIVFFFCLLTRKHLILYRTKSLFKKLLLKHWKPYSKHDSKNKNSCFHKRMKACLRQTEPMITNVLVLTIRFKFSKKNIYILKKEWGTAPYWSYTFDKC